MNQATPLSASADSQARVRRIERSIEIAVAILLAVAASCTAWSGYQARLWSGEQSIFFAQAGQLITLDILIYNEWIKSYAAGQEDLKNFYEKRFRTEFRPAFEAWLATDPANNPDAPTGPFVMPEYKVSKAEEAVALEEEASGLFNQGRQANETSESYILITVFMALVLVFSGFAPRFKWLPVRLAVVAIGLVFLILGLFNIASLPIQ